MDTYKSVSELIKNLPGDEQVTKLLEKEIQGRKLVKLLFYLRCKENLSQKQIAQKIGCTQSRISKIEGSLDDDLTIKDIQEYAKALNLEVELNFNDASMKIVDKIKYHAFRIKGYLEQLSSLSKDDEIIEEGVKRFYKEVFVNMNRIIASSFSKFHRKAAPKPTVSVSAPIENVDLERVQKVS